MTEDKTVPLNDIKEETKIEEPEQAEERSGTEDRQQSADQEPKELTPSSLLVKRRADQF